MASVVNTYARALADVVLSKRLEVWPILAQAESMVGLLKESKPLREVWEAPSIPATQKRAVLDGIVGRLGLSVWVRNFLAVLIDRGRTRLLPEIVAQFRKELNQRLGKAEADITSARQLTAQERESLEADLAQATGKQIHALYSEDRKILGGVIARVGSTVYDGSVKTQLERIRQQIISA
jgi:F-type H+-transporting ATPase subunit delta